jgi:hypothetical protein
MRWGMLLGMYPILGPIVNDFVRTVAGGQCLCKRLLLYVIRTVADEGVQKNGDPYGIHIEQIIDCFTKYFLYSGKSYTPVLYPLPNNRQSDFHWSYQQSEKLTMSGAIY